MISKFVKKMMCRVLRRLDIHEQFSDMRLLLHYLGHKMIKLSCFIRSYSCKSMSNDTNDKLNQIITVK